MNNKQIITRLSRRAQLDYRETSSAVKNVVDSLSAVLCRNMALAVPGFGTFYTELTEEYIGDFEGRRCLMPPHVDVKFSQSNILARKLDASTKDVATALPQGIEVETLQTFCEQVALTTGYTVDFCEKFVAELFKTLTGALEGGDELVALNGLGSFTLKSGGVVSFTPDSQIAEAVNEPFSCFEPEPIDDDVTDEMLSQDISIVVPEVSNDVTTSSEVISEETNPTSHEVIDEETNPTSYEVIDESKEETPNQGTSPEEEDVEEFAENDVNHEDEIVGQVVVNEEAVVDEIENNNEDNTSVDESSVSAFTEVDEEDAEQSQTCRSRICPWLMLLIGLIVGAVAMWTLMNFTTIIPRIETGVSDIESPQTNIDEESAFEEEAQIESETTESAQDESVSDESNTEENSAPEEVVTDTVTRDYYLATMARRHYGNYEYWVYIYEENADKLGHPDRVEPGTVVVIPPAEKYGIIRNDRAALEAARAKAAEILARF